MLPFLLGRSEEERLRSVLDADHTTVCIGQRSWVSYSKIVQHSRKIEFVLVPSRQRENLRYRGERDPRESRPKASQTAADHGEERKRFHGRYFAPEAVLSPFVLIASTFNASGFFLSRATSPKCALVWRTPGSTVLPSFASRPGRNHQLPSSRWAVDVGIVNAISKPGLRQAS
jgi:hypothetical protein